MTERLLKQIHDIIEYSIKAKKMFVFFAAMTKSNQDDESLGASFRSIMTGFDVDFLDWVEPTLEFDEDNEH